MNKRKKFFLFVFSLTLMIILVFSIIRVTPLFWEREAGTTRVPITLPDGTAITEMIAYSYTPRDLCITKHQKQVDASLELALENIAFSFSEENDYLVPEYELISTTPTSAQYKIFSNETGASWEVWVIFENGGADYAVYKGETSQ